MPLKPLVGALLSYISSLKLRFTLGLAALPFHSAALPLSFFLRLSPSLSFPLLDLSHSLAPFCCCSARLRVKWSVGSRLFWPVCPVFSCYKCSVTASRSARRLRLVFGVFFFVFFTSEIPILRAAVVCTICLFLLVDQLLFFPVLCYEWNVFAVVPHTQS